MRPNNKLSVWLAAMSVSCAGLLLMFGNSAWSEQTKETSPRIRELQQKRLAVLEQISEVAKASFQTTRGSYEDVHSASVELFAARRDYAQTREERIKVCDEAVQEAETWLKVVVAMVEKARISPIARLQAEAFVLEARFRAKTLAASNAERAPGAAGARAPSDAAERMLARAYGVLPAGCCVRILPICIPSERSLARRVTRLRPRISAARAWWPSA